MPLMQLSHDHFHACKMHRGGPVTHRHNDIVDALGQIAREARCTWEPEPRLQEAEIAHGAPTPLCVVATSVEL
jgi:hypothetical protein